MFLRSGPAGSKNALLAKMTQASAAEALFGSDRSKNSLLASSSQAPYPSFRRKRQNSLAPLFLLSPKSPKDFSGTPYGVILAYF
ncbi:hypothetical protein, partial [Butyricicoccus sp.]|uniref:hypothetical protein n=1 Tax=Butyricicoccus sp. TaxID=2049021 RepID=UPI003AAFDF41